MNHYQQLQQQRDQLVKAKQSASRKGDTETAERCQFEIKFLNKKLRKIQKENSYFL